MISDIYFERYAKKTKNLEIMETLQNTIILKCEIVSLKNVGNLFKWHQTHNNLATLLNVKLEVFFKNF